MIKCNKLGTWDIIFTTPEGKKYGKRNISTEEYCEYYFQSLNNILSKIDLSSSNISDKIYKKYKDIYKDYNITSIYTDSYKHKFKCMPSDRMMLEYIQEKIDTYES